MIKVILCALLTFSVSSKVYQVPIYDTTRYPLVVYTNGKLSGIYIDSFDTIMKRA